MKRLSSVCVFCGSRPGAQPIYAEAADAFGSELARQGIRLVYGGGNVGLMGRIADAALNAGGEVVGVIPQFLIDREVGHPRLTELHVVETMHQRKAMMATLSDAFAVLPGGIGTFEELFEVWTWQHLKLHVKPCGLLNVGGFYDLLAGFLGHTTAEGFLDAAQRDTLAIESTPAALLRALAEGPHPEKPNGLAKI